MRSVPFVCSTIIVTACIMQSVCSNHGECQCNGCQCELGREGQYCNITLKVSEHIYNIYILDGPVQIAQLPLV